MLCGCCHLSPFVQRIPKRNKDESEMVFLSISPNDMVSLHDSWSTFVSYVFYLCGHMCAGAGGTCNLSLSSTVFVFSICTWDSVHMCQWFWLLFPSFFLFFWMTFISCVSWIKIVLLKCSTKLNSKREREMDENGQANHTGILNYYMPRYRANPALIQWILNAAALQQSVTENYLLR